MVLCLAASGCAATSGKTRQVPLPIGDQQERSLGARLSASVEAQTPLATDKTVKEYVNSLGQRIARLCDRPDIPYTFRVLTVEGEPHSFSLPGGYVYVTTGLLLGIDTECQLAGILAHEVGHIVAHDGTTLLGEEMTDAELAVILRGGPPDSASAAIGKALATLRVGFGRDQERAADTRGLLYCARVGLNPAGMIQAMEKFQSGTPSGDQFWEPLAGNQPPMAERIAGLKQELASMGLDAGLPSDRQPYAKIRVRLP